MSPTATTTRKRRSPLAPAYSVEHCFSAAAALDTEFGRSSFDQPGLARVLGVSATASTTDRLVSALRQFGLLSKVNDDLTLTDRSRTLIDSRSSGDNAAFRAAALETIDTSPLFQEMRDEFGVKLPPEDALVGRFEKSGFTPRSARQAANALSESLRFAGVLDDDDNIIGDLEQIPEAAPEDRESEITPIEQVDFEETPATEAPESAGEAAFLARPRIDVPLGKGRTASVLYPANLTRADVEKVYGVLDALVQR